MVAPREWGCEWGSAKVVEPSIAGAAAVCDPNEILAMEEHTHCEDGRRVHEIW
jgi:hypothetical protein